MCTTCGCSEGTDRNIIDLDLDHGHGHGHDHGHGRAHLHDHEAEDGHEHTHAHLDAPGLASEDRTPSPRRMRLERDVLAKNNALAEGNRVWIEGRGLVAWNLMSSPGAGKTTLLERTLRDIGAERPLLVIEGDQATSRDGERIRAAGGRAVQINTGTGCHLDAEMLADALRRLDPPQGSLVIIENVGNLVCPALFDLGESLRAVLFSVTEGEDKPLKYPHMFRAAHVMVLTKVDLLPYVPFDVGRCLAYARQVNPALEILQVSATSGAGLEDWYERLRRGSAHARIAGEAGSELREEGGTRFA